MALTMGSLFDGIGGFPLAATRHGIDPLWASEIEPFAVRVTQARFPAMRHVGDVTTLRGVDVGPVDILTGGFPCQDVSVAGRRAGLAGARSGLWWEFHRLIAEIRPRWVVIENVAGLLSSNRGRDLGIILRSLDELGYVGAWRVLDAQYAGVPQRRDRIAIVGYSGAAVAAPAEVLLESESLRWPAAADLEAREAPAGSLGGGSGNRGFAVDTDRMTFIPAVFGITDDETVAEELLPTMVADGHKHPPAVAVLSPEFQQHYRKVHRAASDSDAETWEPSEVAPTINTFDAGESRTASAIVYAPPVAQPLRSASDSPAAHNKVNGTDRSALVAYVNDPILHAREVAPSLTQNYGKQPDNSDTGLGPNIIAYVNGAPVKPFEADGLGDSYWDGGQTSDTLDLSVLAKGQMLPEKPRFPVVIQNATRGKDQNGLGITESETMYTLDIVSQHGIIHWLREHIMVRRLTPLECERLQGFPDGWTDIPVRQLKPGAKQSPRKRYAEFDGAVWEMASDSPRYKALGNAIAVPVFSWLLGNIADYEARHGGGE